jgi:hypothetical protein
MFASAAVNWEGLVSPGRTRAGINTANVLQDIRLGGRTFDFDGLAVD